tara:strand:+ start:333 stop:782 length:450 start_codon:yes stop_codon:yes gene_type:complete
MKRKRKARPPELRRTKGGYDSGFERIIHKTVLKGWQHHGDQVQYVVEHKYEPDFVKEVEGKQILIEAKGRFWDHAEYNKYVWIKKVLPDNTELVFLFADPQLPMPMAQKRKDGTKRSHAEWADANKFRWYTIATIPEEWRTNAKESEVE